MHNRAPIILTTSFFIGMMLLITTCSFGQNQSEESNEDAIEAALENPDVDHVDPKSVRLHPAKKKIKAPDFTATLLDSNQFRLTVQRGKVVILNFWATWCAPCHKETPDFVDLYSRYRDEGLVILGISLDDEGASVVRPFLEKYSVNYPIVIDDRTIKRKFNPRMGLPTTYIIDKNGYFRYIARGALTKKELAPRIERLLSE